MGSAAKRKYLLETFPGLRDDHIGDSRSTSFEGLVRNATRGTGVHLCLNALSDEKLQASSSSYARGNNAIAAQSSPERQLLSGACWLHAAGTGILQQPFTHGLSHTCQRS